MVSANLATPERRFSAERLAPYRAGVPCAHLHVHGHRDEFAFMMQDIWRGRPVQRKKRHEVPTT